MNRINQPSPYQEEVAQYAKKDAIHALLFAAYIALMTIVFLIVVLVFNLSDNDRQISFVGRLLDVGMVTLYLVSLFVIVRKKGQGLRSLGLHLIEWKKALGAGLIFLAVNLFLFDGLLPGLLANWQMRSALMTVWFVVFLLIKAFFEDVVFIGYMQTRIHGLIKNEILAILAVAFIFATFHYPGMIALNILADGSFGLSFWGTLVFYTLFWMIGHIFMNIVFRRFRSIIPVTLLHFSINIAQIGALWEHRSEDGLNEILSVVIIGFVLLSTCIILPHLKKCNHI